METGGTPDERRLAEQDAAPSVPAADASTLDIAVRDPLGAPVGCALVVLFRGETALGDARTDVAGNAVVPALGGEGEYVLFAEGWASCRGTIDLSAGSRTLSLVEGATVAGRVLVDGAAPREPIELVWSTSPNAPTGLDWHKLPASIRKLVFQQRGRGSEAVLRTIAGGSFAFRGLVADVSGTLHWRGPYLEDVFPPAHGNYRSVAAPRDDLDLRLVTGLEIRMRFVSDTGTPIPSAFAKFELSGTHELDRTIICDTRGVARKVVRHDVRGPIRITAGRTGTSPTWTFDAEKPTAPEAVWDLGDFVLPSTRTLTLHARDAEGRPVQSARATAWLAGEGRSSWRSTTTDSLQLDVAAGPSRILVQAFGFLGARVDVAADETEATATLARACTLEILTPEGAATAAGLELELECDGPMFVEDPESPELHMRTPGVPILVERSSHRTRAKLTGTATPRWRVGALLPGTPLRARVSSYSRVLCEMSIDAWVEGEHREIRLPPFDHTMSELVLSVQRPSGTPMGGAAVLQIHDGQPRFEPEMLGITNVDGQCRLRLDETRGTLLIRHELFAPKLVSFDSIPAEPLVVRMEEGRTVEIELVRPDGTPSEEVSTVTHESRLCGFKRAEALGAGRFRVTGLVPGLATFCFRLPRGDVLRVHDASIPHLRVTLGGPGRVTVRIPTPSNPSEGRWTVAVAERGLRTPFVRVGLVTGDGGWLTAVLGELPLGDYEAWIEQASETEFDRWTAAFPARPFAITEQEPRATIDFETLR
ncbi:MAG: hypothetical protein IPK67_18780 [Planctomycetes bacterium]|nr:hypothetical protein [Planctomycetota bacterium]